MELADIWSLYVQEQRQEITFPSMEKHVLPRVVRFVRPAPGMSFVLYSQVDENTVEEEIEAQIAYFQPRNQRWEWKVYDLDTPADLRQRLLARGFEADEPEAVMVLDLQDVPPALLAPVTAVIRRVITAEQLQDVMVVEHQVWGYDFSWIPNRLGPHLAMPGYLSMYVADADGEPACVGWTYFYPNSQFASLFGGSTVAKFRKRGLYTAILATRVQEAIQRNYRFLTIDASDMSAPILAKHGFRVMTMAHACEWKSGEKSAERPS